MKMNWIVVVSLFLSIECSARPNFEKKKIIIGTKIITVEVADSGDERSHGLMFIEKLAVDEGMLFVFDIEEPLSFWMKNTLIPLSIAYTNSKKEIVDIQEMVREKSLLIQSPKTYPSKSPARYAIEMNKGWFTKNKIKTGARWNYLD